jgi:hypothetical protein
MEAEEMAHFLLTKSELLLREQVFTTLFGGALSRSWGFFEQGEALAMPFVLAGLCGNRERYSHQI